MSDLFGTTQQGLLGAEFDTLAPQKGKTRMMLWTCAGDGCTSEIHEGAYCASCQENERARIARWNGK